MDINEARALGVQIIDPEDGSVELLMEHGPDVIDALLRAIKETEAQRDALAAGVHILHDAARARDAALDSGVASRIDAAEAVMLRTTVDLAVIAGLNTRHESGVSK